ncbi:MAG: HAMP domain-containing protein [Clostridia bacterium]|nr:HAMP domain-containing protein [Clostridia bacterium]
MRNSIFAKIMASFLVVLILIVAQGVIAYIGGEINSQKEREIHEAHSLETFMLQKEIDHHLWMIRLYDMFIGGPIPEITSHKECSLGSWYYATEPEEHFQTPFANLEEPHKRLHESGKRVVEAYKLGEREKAEEIFRAEVIPAVTAVRSNLQEIQELEAVYVKSLEQEMDILDATIQKVTILGMILCFLVATILAFILTRAIANPLKKMVKASELIAAGNLTAKADINRKDEIGQLANAFNYMVQSL